jgi:hypothetical protein
MAAEVASIVLILLSILLHNQSEVIFTSATKNATLATNRLSSIESNSLKHHSLQISDIEITIRVWKRSYRNNSLSCSVHQRDCIIATTSEERSTNSEKLEK